MIIGVRGQSASAPARSAGSTDGLPAQVVAAARDLLPVPRSPGELSAPRVPVGINLWNEIRVSASLTKLEPQENREDELLRLPVLNIRFVLPLLDGVHGRL